MYAIDKEGIMAASETAERRAHPRADARVMVSYWPRVVATIYDISQSRNVGQGGMLLTTSRAFEKGTSLAMRIRIRGASEDMGLTGQVVGSTEVAKGVIYETRVHFVKLNNCSVNHYTATPANPSPLLENGPMRSATLWTAYYVSSREGKLSRIAVPCLCR